MKARAICVTTESSRNEVDKLLSLNRAAPEDEMIAIFLRAEVNSLRFGERLRKVMAGLDYGKLI